MSAANTVYMTQEPPPYPGIYAPAGQPPAYSQFNGATGGTVPPPMTAAGMYALEVIA